ncbi:unnamed protein product [Dimorphilus gyrociliatus]|uniref:Uncharacterized protein n=1 Tax=Dimorphilus gyrociliatus TaxID=2664684 RepID=A0A7I8VDL8_9ANNE|nr:unnamed protein product [Dimorphilus gyrociliatus]
MIKSKEIRHSLLFSWFRTMKSYIFIILILRLKLFNTKMYRSCIHALLDNGNSTGVYEIQPFNYGNYANISCSLIEENVVLTELATNSNPNEAIFSSEIGKSVKKNFSYPNLNETEVIELMKYGGICSQSMYFYGIGINQASLHFKFSDGTVYLMNKPRDGICKCIIAENCSSKKKTRRCIVKYINTTIPMINMTGELAVSSKRLPLTNVEYEDVDVTGRYIFHHVKPLSCKAPLKRNFKSIFNSQCNPDYNLLEDKDKDTCIKFSNSFAYLEMSYSQVINIYSPTIENLSIKVYTKLKSGRLAVCLLSKDNTFICFAKASGIYMHILNVKEQDVIICEISSSVFI